MSAFALETTGDRPRISVRGPHADSVTLWLLAAFVALVSFAPLMQLLKAALAPEGALDLSHAFGVLWKPQVLRATGNTLVVAVASTALATLVGTAAAVLTALTDMRTRNAWVFAFVLPLMIPPQVTALAWVQAFSPSSPILGFFGLSLPAGIRHPLYSASGIIVLMGLYNAPLVFLAVRASLRRLPADLMEAGQAAGAGPWRLLSGIALPLARAGIVGGAAAAFVSSIGNFGIQAMLGIPAQFPTLITLIYQRMNSYGPSALSSMAVLSIALAALTLAGLAVSSRLGGRRDVRVDGNARPARLALHRWNGVTTGLAWLFLVLTLALPLSALLTTSLVTGFGQALTLTTLTLDNYANALFHHAAVRNAFLTSFWLTAIAVVVLMALSVLLGYFMAWRRNRLVRVLHLCMEISYALPGVVMGVAMILFFIQPIPVVQISLYGTVWIILIAYFSNFLALAVRTTLTGFAQIDRSVEEAAQVAGAGFVRRMRDIIAPLVAPAAFASGVIVFMTALNEIQVSILLVSSSAATIGPMVVFLEEGGSSTLAAAVGCLMVLIVVALMATASAFSHRLPRGVLPWRD